MAVSDKEFGIMKSDVKHISKTIDKHTTMLEDISTKLDLFVTKTEFNNYVVTTKHRISDIDTRISELERGELAIKNSLWNKIGMSFEKAIVAVLVGAIVSGIIFFMILNNNVKDINRELRNHESAERIKIKKESL